MAWFEACSDGYVTIVRRVDRSSAGLSTQLSTIAEMLHAAGRPYPGVGPSVSSRDIEVAMEALYAEEPREVFDSVQLWEDDEDIWKFNLTNPEPAELKYLNEVDTDGLSKMALARCVELRQGTDRRRAWNTLSVAGLVAALCAP